MSDAPAGRARLPVTTTSPKGVSVELPVAFAESPEAWAATGAGCISAAETAPALKITEKTDAVRILITSFPPETFHWTG
jgi:hypothetical protein